MERASATDVLLVGCIPPPIGGVSQHVWRLAHRLSEHGVRAQVLDTHPEADKYTVPAGQLRTSPNGKILKAAWLAQQLHRQPHAVSHFHYSLVRSPTALAGLLHACPKQQRKVLTLHHGDLQSHFDTLSRRAQQRYRKTLAKFDAILSLSPKQTRFYRWVLGVPASQIVASSSLLHLPSALVQTISAKTAPDPWQTLNLEGTFRIVASGFPHPAYWHAEAVRMVDRLRSRHDAKLALCLYGPRTKYLEELQQLANERPHVRLLWGLDFIPFMQLLAKSSLYVRPTTKDSFGLAVTDAAGVGIPVVASDVCPRDPRARLFRTGSQTAFAESVETCLEDSGRPAAVTNRESAPLDAYESILAAYRLPGVDTPSLRHRVA